MNSITPKTQQSPNHSMNSLGWKEWTLFSAFWFFAGVQVIAYLKPNWLPNWFLLSLALVILVSCVLYLVWFTIRLSNDLPSTLAKLKFKSNWFVYLIFGTIAVTGVAGPLL